MRPVIGVMPLYDPERDSYWMLPGYLHALERCGALPVVLPMTAREDALCACLSFCEGLLFTGGQDVSPTLYGESPSPLCGAPCPGRDAMEIKLLNAALQKDVPVFGICRGIQLFNVCLGGSLYQDLPSQHPSGTEHHMTPPYDRAVHRVTVLSNTPLAALLPGQGELAVNSYHHQAVKTLAPALRPMALSEDGLVEGVWLPGKRFAAAVQWHPELFFEKDAASLALFEAFVRACRPHTP